MSQLDALLARSRSPGTFVEKRSFTLARSKAIEKMREFTLRHPRQYVLELVQAAVFAGARWIAVDVRSDALVVAWVGGKTLTATELQDLFDYLFADQGQTDSRHLMQTAIGINAILQRKPRRIRVESGDGHDGSTSRMDLDGKGKGTVGTPESPLAGTYIYADFGKSWFGRFAAVDSFPPEAELVETRCVYTPTPILLNGNAPFGYRSSRAIQLFGVKRSVAFDQDRCRGALGIPESGVKEGVRLVVGGVWVNDRVLSELGSPIVGVIADDRLRKTADMSDIVEDGRFVDMLHVAQPFATEVLRRVHGPSYRAPQLPARVAEQSGTAGDAIVALEPLPQTLRQVGARAPIPLASVLEMGASEPLFWAEQDVADTLTPAVDPTAFPYRVLILTPGQARTLEQTLGTDGPRPSRLTNPEDASFVRNAMERRHEVHRVSVEVDLNRGRGRQPRLAQLTLALHLSGPEPRWDGEHTDGPGIPVAIRDRSGTRSSVRLDLPLEHVSVVVTLTDKTDAVDGLGLLAALREIVQREAWRLLPTDDATQADHRKKRLELALLAQHGRPQFSHLGDRAPQVHVRLPSTWRPVQDRLLDAPLLDTDDGPLTLRRLASLQGSDRVLRVASRSERALVAPLEAQFGYGHLVAPEDAARPIICVGRMEEPWRPIAPGDLGQEAIEQVILVFPSLATPPPPAGWQSHDTLGPGIAHWVRKGRRPQAIRMGADAAFSALQRMIRAGTIGDADADRRIALARLASVRLASVADRLGEIRFTGGGRTQPLPAWLADPRTHAVARGGAAVRQPDVLPVSLDEVRAINELLDAKGGGSTLPLLVDDHPDLWHAEASGEEWLVRVDIDHPGLRGWLGLRSDWDPTASVLLETPDGVEVLTDFTQNVPCHGLLHLSGAKSLSRPQRELLQLGGVQLYQRLCDQLEAELPELSLAAARRYATAYAAVRWYRDGALRPGLARTLALRVPVDDAQGRPWGNLHDWLATAEGERPAAPEGLPSPAASARTGAVQDLDDAEQLYGFIAGPLQRALQAQRPEIRVQITEGQGSDPLVALPMTTDARLRLELVRSELVNRCLGGDHRARGLVLLEATRVAIDECKRTGVGIDPLAVQQAVLASRVAR